MNNPEQSTKNEEQNPSEENKESYDRGVVEHNLKMLKEDMWELLKEESMGGNAGSIEVNGKRYPCAAANGYANSKTGEIIIFGNIQDIDQKIVKSNSHITLRIEMFESKIIDFFGKEKISEEGRVNIEKAIEEYNLNQNSSKSEE